MCVRTQLSSAMCSFCVGGSSITTLFSSWFGILISLFTIDQYSFVIMPYPSRPPFSITFFTPRVSTATIVSSLLSAECSPSSNTALGDTSENLR